MNARPRASGMRVDSTASASSEQIAVTAIQSPPRVTRSRAHIGRESAIGLLATVLAFPDKTMPQHGTKPKLDLADIFPTRLGDTIATGGYLRKMVDLVIITRQVNNKAIDQAERVDGVIAKLAETPRA